MMKTLCLCLAFSALCGVYSSAPALAQTADTTSAWRYLALDVGNVWEYERWADVCAPEPPFCEPEPDGFTRIRVLGDTTLDGTAYWIIREARIRQSGTLAWTQDALVRYDSTEARAYEYRLDGELWDYWPGGLYCPLDLPFEWEEGCQDYGYAESYEQVVFGEPALVKHFVTQLGTYAFVADLGLVSSSGGDFVTAGMDLTFARIGGVEYGSEQFPVAAEPAPSESALTLAVYPNPVRGDATVRFALDAPQRVTLAVFDVLGRRVLTTDLGPQPAGEVMHRLDAARLPAGLYVVRLTGDAGASATARIVLHSP
ncbi:MAG: T9SS type A sorting domain-containing protein [Rhodothermales bacterium]